MSILRKVPCMCPSDTTPPPVYIKPDGQSFSHKPSDNTKYSDWSISNLSQLNALQTDVNFNLSNDIYSLDDTINHVSYINSKIDIQ